MFLRNNSIVVLVIVLFAGNMVIHVLGPILIGQPFVMYMYFNYYAPFGAMLGGLGLVHAFSHVQGRSARRLLVGGFAVAVLFSLFPQGSASRWPPDFANPDLRNVNRASQRLAALTTPSDKIFAITCLHEFLVADRLPYPPLLLADAISLNKDIARVTKFGRYNYAMAGSYLKEADVVILSDYAETELAGLYRGHRGAGQDVVDLAERVVAEDFTLIEKIQRTSKGIWRIYRRKSAR